MSKLNDKRGLKYGGFSIAITVLVVIAVLAANVLATYIETNNGLRVDFTPTASYTLDKNAEAAIGDLDKDVIIYTFIPANSSSTYSYLTENIVEVFSGASDKITSRNVDPVVNPSKLEQFSTNTKELSAYAVVVAEKDNEENFHAYNESELVEYNSKTQKNYFVLQRWITSALMYMRTGIRNNVYVLTGHGENTGDEMQTVFNRIRRENYNVEEINLLSGQAKLEQGDILLVLQPKSDLTKDEYDTIIAFLDDSYGDMLFAEIGKRNPAAHRARKIEHHGSIHFVYIQQHALSFLPDFVNTLCRRGVAQERNVNQPFHRPRDFAVAVAQFVAHIRRVLPASDVGNTAVYRKTLTDRINIGFGNMRVDLHIN